jgi:hypothetical protein
MAHAKVEMAQANGSGSHKPSNRAVTTIGTSTAAINRTSCLLFGCSFRVTSQGHVRFKRERF